MYKIGDHIATRTEKGTWDYKPIEKAFVVGPKKKEQHDHEKELPEFEMSNVIEGISKGRYDKQLKDMTIEIVNFLKDNL